MCAGLYYKLVLDNILLAFIFYMPLFLDLWIYRMAIEIYIYTYIHIFCFCNYFIINGLLSVVYLYLIVFSFKFRAIRQLLALAGILCDFFCIKQELRWKLYNQCVVDFFLMDTFSNWTTSNTYNCSNYKLVNNFKNSYQYSYLSISLIYWWKQLALYLPFNSTLLHAVYMVTF